MKTQLPVLAALLLSCSLANSVSAQQSQFGLEPVIETLQMKIDRKIEQSINSAPATQLLSQMNESLGQQAKYIPAPACLRDFDGYVCNHYPFA